MAYIPKPFKRPSVTVATSTGKQWKEVTPIYLSIGDIVQYRGRVDAIFSESGYVTLYFADRSSEVFETGQTVRAFTHGDGR